jgi:hypothetical protein
MRLESNPPEAFSLPQPVLKTGCPTATMLVGCRPPSAEFVLPLESILQVLVPEAMFVV